MMPVASPTKRCKSRRFATEAESLWKVFQSKLRKERTTKEEGY